jgi:hypothetical protein
MKLTIHGTPTTLATLALVIGCSGSTVFDGEGDAPQARDGSEDGDGDGAGANGDGVTGADGDGDNPSGGDDMMDTVGAIPGAAADDGCVSTREFMATEAWPNVLGTVCLSCHGPGGIAANQSAEFTLQPSAYPGFLDVNLEQVRGRASIESDDRSVLLRKPLGELNHGGGVVLAEDSAAYETLERLVERVLTPEACDDTAAVTALDDVELLDAEGTFRKAALALAARLPLGSEVTDLRDRGEVALNELLDSLLAEDAFYERLVEIFNDQWLTDRYINNAQGLLREEDFPNARTYYDSLTPEQQVEARRSVAREPLELMAHIVRNERPFTEIVTANYTVFNPYTANVYNNDGMAFSDAYNAREFQEGTIFAVKEGSMTPFPHAGILTSPMFLNRYPTSATNRNRHRARIVLRELLATDILKVADRPIDPTKAVSFANPTREEESCSMCHVTLDPIAGAFQKWDDNDYERYLPNREWHTEMYAPGFDSEKMTLAEFEIAPQWLGTRIAADPRFPISVVNNMYEALIGQEPTAFPENPSSGAYAAWEAQDSTMRAITQAFVESGFNLKVAIKRIVLSPYFRAANTSATDPTRLAQLDGVGTGRLLTPELLHAKIEGVFGTEWMDGGRAMLLDGLRILYGGIDSDSVTARLTTPNGMMSSIMWRASTELACRNAAMDFSKDQANRRLFRNVELDTVPENELAEPVEESAAMIRENIRYLYYRMLGEALADDSAEMVRVYDLFLTTWREGRAKLASEDVGRSLNWECQYRRAPGASEDLPEDQRLERDDNYVIRSWMAVLTYLIADYRFLYD